ncbi:MAG TPA: hypothetical protein VGM19_08165 [Armatimonadota bacterium]|jgi:hypothetical protein
MRAAWRWVLLLAVAAVALGRVAAAEPLIVNGGFEEWVDVMQVPEGLRQRPEVVSVVRIPENLWPRQWIPMRVPYRTGGPGTSEIALDETVAHSGRRSVRLTSRSTKDITCVEYIGEYALGSAVPPAAIQPNRRYRLTWWVKGLAVLPGGGGAMLEGIYYVSLLNGKGYRTAPDYGDQTRPPTGTFDWQQEQFDFLTDAGAKYLAFNLQLRETTGTIWYDDVELQDLGPAMVVETY